MIVNGSLICCIMNILVCQPPPSPPVQKADNCYQLDDSAIGFTNTYLMERYQRVNKRVMGPFLESART